MQNKHTVLLQSKDLFIARLQNLTPKQIANSFEQFNTQFPNNQELWQPFYYFKNTDTKLGISRYESQQIFYIVFTSKESKIYLNKNSILFRIAIVRKRRNEYTFHNKKVVENKLSKKQIETVLKVINKYTTLSLPFNKV